MARVAALKGDANIGIRMHWLLQDEHTPRELEAAGYAYDSTSGYNDAIGYRAGTHQVFRPLGRERLMEMPMHIQDGACSIAHQARAVGRGKPGAAAERVIANAELSGGVLTVLWHDRSLGPERHWGDLPATHRRVARAPGVVRECPRGGRLVPCTPRRDAFAAEQPAANAPPVQYAACRSSSCANTAPDNPRAMCRGMVPPVFNSRRLTDP
jgi:hypothetical protein